MIATTLVKLIRSLALMIVLGSISPANSEIDFKDYRDLKNTLAFKTYLNGVGVGYSGQTRCSISAGSRCYIANQANLLLAPITTQTFSKEK
jgi:hypothetical protein